MKVSRQFLKDFAYLANFHGWTPEEIEGVKAEIRENPALVRYWSVIADAHRKGYRQTPENGFIRLVAWCEQQGYPNPFSDEEVTSAAI